MARRSTKQVKELILAAAEREFSLKGYAKTTTDDIADSAGVSLSVLFRHFPAKADLFRDALMQPFLESLRTFTEHWEHTNVDPVDEREVMHLFISDIYDHLQGHREALTALLSAEHTIDDRVTAEVHQRFDQIFGQFARMGQREALRRGWFPGEPMELNSRILVALITATVAHRQWFLPAGRKRLSREKLVNHITQLMLYGLRLAPPDRDPDLPSSATLAVSETSPGGEELRG
jgi:AcrR family transcriptional regulator